MNTQAQAGGNSLDLLSSILGVTVRNEEKISEQDRAFCQQQQEKLYHTLDQLAGWYDIFKGQASDPRYERFIAKWQADGSVEFKEPYGCYPNSEGNYEKFEFYPFENINRIVKLARKAYLTFSQTIVRYFNRQYGLSVPDAGIGTQTLAWGYRPDYAFLVDHVIGHLGGKSFRETAEEELVARFLDVVEPWNRDTVKPEIKGNSIVFPRAVSYGDYSWDRDNKIGWDNLRKFNDFCAGILFFATTSINGHAGCIADFDHENVDFSKWYNMTPGGKVMLKLYKNGRADVKFSDKHFTERCFMALRLDTLKLHNDIY